MVMLGSTCSPCCNVDVCGCQQGTLPPRVAISFNRLSEVTLVPTAVSSCFGSGAKVSAYASSGKIELASIENPGSGYATLGREPPTITLGNANAKAAEVSFSYTQSSDKCGRPIWSISGATVISGGDGYTNAEPATFTLAGSTKGSGAVGTIYTQRAAPVLDASASSGSGVTFTVNVEETGANPPTWRVESVTFKGQGFGYVDGEMLSFGGGGVATIDAASATIQVNYSQPAVEVRPFGVSGDGATLSAVLSANGGTPPTWSVTAVSIDAAGTGYAPGDWFAVYNLDTGGFTSNDVFVEGVGDNGEITAVGLYPGSPLASSSELESVEVLSGGEYYGGNQILDSIEITNGGEYYGEDPALPVYVADIQVTPDDEYGSGAVLSAEVNDDPQSATFGQIVSVAVNKAGTSYGSKAPSCDYSINNGGSYWLPKTSKCEYSACISGFIATVTYAGHEQPPTVRLSYYLGSSLAQGCSIVLSPPLSDSPWPCDPLAFTVPFGDAGSIEVGGTEKALDCLDIRNASSITLEIEAKDVTDDFLHQRPYSLIYHRGGAYSPLAQYAGEFELTRIPGSRVLFRYDYDSSEPDCKKNAYLFVEFVEPITGRTFLEYGIGNQLSISGNVFANTIPAIIPVGQLACDPPLPVFSGGGGTGPGLGGGGGTPGSTSVIEPNIRYFNPAFLDIVDTASCICGPGPLPDLFGFVVARAVSSDGFFLDRGPWFEDGQFNFEKFLEARRIGVTITDIAFS